MAQKNETTILVLSLLVTAALLGLGFWWFTSRSGVNLGGLVSPKNGQSGSTGFGGLQDRISLGEKILIAADTNPSKQAGAEAFAKGDFQGATAQFQTSLQKNRNDPEALIYLNNASVANSKPIKIAVSVPIGGNLNVAKEILRGVAQAQTETIRTNQLNVQVEIANDDNNPAIAKQLATDFVKDTGILAVIGHNSSDVTLAAASEYQNGKLVVISPTSDAKALSGIGSYVFRTIPSIRTQAEVLANYTTKTVRKRNITICVDSQAQSSQSLKDEFTAVISTSGGKVASINCDVSAPTFNASAIMSQSISQGVDGLLLLPSVDRLNQALDVAQANQRRLSLLGSSTLYTIQTLQQGQAAVNGMVLAVAWHPTAIPGNPFAENAVKLWGGAVNWRSATAYDAAEAIIAGLKRNNTREGLQQVLSTPGFSANGATGSVQFLPTGDRNGTAILLQIKPGQGSNTGFDFVPWQP
ncbi:MAG: ABC transporter substrate-binding protein [Cyanobacteriota bacterium]|nr:ABC transporter substrate-binding protein [Cyanobacteriota bacterium]